MAKRTLSSQAQVAKRIREFCKKKGIKCRATSESFAGGNSVNVKVYNIAPEIYKEIEDYANQHQYGHFNGMEDIYEYSNSRKDIPQAKFVFIRNDFSKELEQEAFNWLRNQYPGNAKNLPESYDEAKEINWYTGEKDWNHHQMVRQQVYEVLTGDDLRCDNWRDFWEQQQAA